jgi:hypothetical protein
MHEKKYQLRNKYYDADDMYKALTNFHNIDKKKIEREISNHKTGIFMCAFVSGLFIKTTGRWTMNKLRSGSALSAVFGMGTFVGVQLPLVYGSILCAQNLVDEGSRLKLLNQQQEKLELLNDRWQERYHTIWKYAALDSDNEEAQDYVMPHAEEYYKKMKDYWTNYIKP